MKIRAYSPKTGNLIAEDITGINFGNILQGEHSSIPVLIRPVLEDEEAYSLNLYLANNGGFSNTEYGYLVSDQFVPGVESFDDVSDGGFIYISDHFQNPSETSDAIEIAVDDAGVGEYIWLDVKPGDIESGSTNSLVYRFLFEFF
jgi:hypothetical protein